MSYIRCQPDGGSADAVVVHSRLIHQDCLVDATHAPNTNKVDAPGQAGPRTASNGHLFQAPQP